MICTIKKWLPIIEGKKIGVIQNAMRDVGMTDVDQLVLAMSFMLLVAAFTYRMFMPRDK